MGVSRQRSFTGGSTTRPSDATVRNWGEQPPPITHWAREMEERQYGPVWYNPTTPLNPCTIGIGGSIWNVRKPIFAFREDSSWFHHMNFLGDRNLPAPSPTLLALLADLPLSGCWAAVVDRIIEEYPETEPYIRPVLEAYDASTSTVSETDTVGANSSAK